MKTINQQFLKHIDQIRIISGHMYKKFGGEYDDIYQTGALAFLELLISGLDFSNRSSSYIRGTIKHIIIRRYYRVWCKNLDREIIKGHLFTEGAIVPADDSHSYFENKVFFKQIMAYSGATDREKQVLILYFYFDLSEKDIGVHLGYTRQYIQQIKKAILNRIIKCKRLGDKEPAKVYKRSDGVKFKGPYKQKQDNGRVCSYYIKIVVDKKERTKHFPSLTKANKFIKRIKEHDQA